MNEKGGNKENEHVFNGFVGQTVALALDILHPLQSTSHPVMPEHPLLRHM